MTRNVCIWCAQKVATLAHWCSTECAEMMRDETARGIASAKKRRDEFQSYVDDMTSHIAYFADWHEKATATIASLASSFYKSREWRELRYAALEKHGRKCVACGRTPDDDVKIHVDHIKPRSKHPELALDINNLQVMCEDCNLGKGNKFATDWRKTTAPRKEQPLELPDF